MGSFALRAIHSMPKPTISSQAGSLTSSVLDFYYVRKTEQSNRSRAMAHDFMPGLAGVPAARSAVSDVDGERGILEYRGIRIEDLCARSTFLETSWLLLFGQL